MSIDPPRKEQMQSEREKELRCVIADLTAQVRERDAVLKQALEVLGLIGCEDEPHYDDKIKAIAAIKGILNE
jgi:hypothetical protein